ncbi:MAG: recombination protein O N-terminal domain-containing protein [bacterium]|nr:recombination protein O N-terminal domain-containing protein [bacterium]
MRHKYETRALALSRSPLGEANVLVTLLTPDLGFVRARAQGLRRSGAKLASSLATLTESEVVLVRGKESWRVAGAVLVEDWFIRLGSREARTRAARLSDLLLRLIADGTNDPALFPILRGFFNALATLREDSHEAAEVLAAIRTLAALGLDRGGIPGDVSAFTEPMLSDVMKERTGYIARINNGIAASGL